MEYHNEWVWFSYNSVLGCELEIIRQKSAIDDYATRKRRRWVGEKKKKKNSVLKFDCQILLIFFL